MKVIIWVSIRLAFGILLGTTLAYRYHLVQTQRELNFCKGIIKMNQDIKQPVGRIDLI